MKLLVDLPRVIKTNFNSFSTLHFGWIVISTHMLISKQFREFLCVELFQS